MRDRRRALDVAAAVGDRETVDWSRLAETGDARTRTLIEPLRAIDAVAEARVGIADDRADPREGPGPWAGPVMLIAGAQVLAGIWGFDAGRGVPSDVPAGGALAAVVAFAIAALWLFAGAARDRRARSLAGFYLAVASAFARRFVGVLDGTLAEPLVLGVYPDAFLPAFLWAFAVRFPRVPASLRLEPVGRAGYRLAVGASGILFVANVVLARSPQTAFAQAWSRESPTGWYWAVVLGLAVAALALMALRARAAHGDERRRVTLFSGALVAALAPVLLETLAEIVFPTFRTLMARPPVTRAASVPLFALLLLMPFATAYAVLVDRVLDVRIVIGRALRYALARATLLAASVLPFAVLAIYAARHSELPLRQLLAGGRGGLAIALGGAGMTLLWARPRLLRHIDRVFFRASLDLGHALAELTRQLHAARSLAEAAELVQQAVESALGASSASVFRAHAQVFAPVRGALAPLPFDSAIGALLRADPSPLVVGPDAPSSVFFMLPVAERQWVTRAGVAVLAPLAAGRNDPIGCVAVGGKRSELPFRAGELSFIAGAAAAATLAMHARTGAAHIARGAEDGEPASECPSCGAVSGEASERCACGARLRTAALPTLLHGKFRVDRRLGAGGMGLVYRARDETLDRLVALKTLSRLSHDAAERLAQEARVMASVVHPNLATIYGIERWRDTPILVVELLDGGTLADRIARAPLPIDHVLRIGLLLAPALEQLHQAGVLHRDVKPSNIAFTGGDIPKLLDFGLASLAGGLDGAAPAVGSATQTIEVGHGVIAGTPLYVPPEALRGRTPDRRFDLWALSLVLYEALAGRHPFTAPTVPDVLARVRQAYVPDVREFRQDCPEAVAGSLSRWLSAEPDARPASATGLHDEIAAALTRLP